MSDCIAWLFIYGKQFNSRSFDRCDVFIPLVLHRVVMITPNAGSPKNRIIYWELKKSKHGTSLRGRATILSAPLSKVSKSPWTH